MKDLIKRVAAADMDGQLRADIISALLGNEVNTEPTSPIFFKNEYGNRCIHMSVKLLKKVYDHLQNKEKALAAKCLREAIDGMGFSCSIAVSYEIIHNGFEFRWNNQPLKVEPLADEVMKSFCEGLNFVGMNETGTINIFNLATKNWQDVAVPLDELKEAHKFLNEGIRYKARRIILNHFEGLSNELTNTVDTNSIDSLIRSGLPYKHNGKWFKAETEDEFNRKCRSQQKKRGLAYGEDES